MEIKEKFNLALKELKHTLTNESINNVYFISSIEMFYYKGYNDAMRSTEKKLKNAMNV